MPIVKKVVTWKTASGMKDMTRKMVYPPHYKPVRACRQRTEVKCGDGWIMGWSGHKEWR